MSEREAQNLADRSKKRVTIVRFNEPSSTNQSSTRLMVPPRTDKKISITSSTFTEDLDGYLEPMTFITDNDYDAADHVRFAFINQITTCNHNSELNFIAHHCCIKQNFLFFVCLLYICCLSNCACNF